MKHKGPDFSFFVKKRAIPLVPLPLNTRHVRPRLGISDAATTYDSVRRLKKAPLVELNGRSNEESGAAGVRTIDLAFDIREMADHDRTTPHTLR
jgi:hypothetical protein